MKRTALFARLNALLQWCGPGSGRWLGCRKTAETYTTDFLLCSNITSVFPFQTVYDVTPITFRTAKHKLEL